MFQLLGDGGDSTELSCDMVGVVLLRLVTLRVLRQGSSPFPDIDKANTQQHPLKSADPKGSPTHI